MSPSPNPSSRSVRNRIRDVIGLPERTEAPPYYFKYIDRISNGDVREELAAQRDEALELFSGIPEETSLRRYAPEKWSVRQVLNHVTTPAGLFRAFWFRAASTLRCRARPRGRDRMARPTRFVVDKWSAGRPRRPWFLREPWMTPERSGIASGYPFT